MEINKITSTLTTPLLDKETPKNSPSEQNFGALLAEYLGKVNQANLQAEKLSQDLALGKNVELHQVMLATEQASLALQLTVQIRNKVIEAYQEVMRMQV
ncbi:MAG: flagellar hook-basal body complex protein FliE [Bacillota bacterium]|jgi:flagellar hook-basal body complex protein FliE|uniref:Flagellar hook-basal body complex protein FliE n=1 Tax=Thermanaerosceptrum fracticalcis TaxID=1712410 RepID=A0A7G6E121_THEFR|nr:flagellar hook-basal body complex protein FliE [Thermanaerosceptrum fracticalcis]MBZ4653161.1 flagellar hook-basal body protein FliE [Peptococcaceae bacterium]QNB45775.1 flagellar hook-basal body complex protein FliE [Thermanaerosceptrum fracticalcis]